MADNLIGYNIENKSFGNGRVSDQTRIKMSIVHSNVSEQSRRKMSESKKGKESPFKGFKQSEEAKEKMRISKIGNKNSLGRIISQESRERMRTAALKRFQG